jgi:hypothetical protein
MSWASAVLKAIWHLFVDDAAFALLVAGWLALMWALPALGLKPIWDRGLLFLGLSVILVYVALRRAKAH